MPEGHDKSIGGKESNLGLAGFENFFEGGEDVPALGVTADGESLVGTRLDKLVSKLTELISLTVDQRVETSRITGQLIENQRQLVATQQILIRLMERSIELTRHISAIEEKLPAVFELPSMVEQLRVKLEHMEAVELD